MFLNKKFFIYFFLFFFKLNSISASENIAFLDLDYVLNNSNLGKKIYMDLDIINKQNLSELKSKEKNIKDKRDLINKTKNISSKEKLENDIAKFNQEVENFNKEKDKIIKNFQELKNTKLDDFLKNITPIIQDYMAENSIDILLEKKNIFIGKDSKDITNEIIKIINGKFKTNG